MQESSALNPPSVNKPAVYLVALLTAFLTPFMASSVTVALPAIGREFSLSAVALSWIISAYLLAIAVFLVPFGRAGDLYGRRKVFFYGAVVFTLATLACGCAPTVGSLLLFRIVQGMGAAMIFGTGVAMLTSVVEPRKRGAALGFNVAATYLGLSLGPPLGGLCTQSFGWRSVFFVSVPVGIAILAIASWKIRGELSEVTGGRFDFKGSLLYGMGLVSLMYGLSHLPNPVAIGLTGGGAALLLLFARFESKTASPVLSLFLFKRNTVFAFSNAAALLNYSATAGATFLLSLYLQYVKGLPPKNAGIVLIAQPVLMMLFSPFAGRLSDRVEPRIVASCGMAFTAAGLLLLSRLTESISLAFVAAGLMLIGTGTAFFSSPNTSAVMGAVERSSYGSASSILGTSRLVGQMLSMGIAAMLLATFVGGAVITPGQHGAFITSTRISFLVFGSLCILGIFASLSRGSVRTKAGEQMPESGTL
jgi:EmrB/QacA subfamily drug resistance transporter